MLLKKPRILHLMGIVFFMMTLLSAQDEILTEQEKKTFIEKDLLLNKLQSQLPAHWKIEISKDFLNLKREGEIWILQENKINAPMHLKTKEEHIQRIQKYGQKGTAQFRFKRTPKWTLEETQQAQDTNDGIYKTLQQLPAKHQIEHFFSKNPNRKGPTTLRGCTEEENKRIQRYTEEKEALEKTLIRFPDYNTSQLSLFLEAIEGMEDEFHTVHPEEASSEMYQIQNIMNELLR